jgi:signal transduction histidine kinase
MLGIIFLITSTYALVLGIFVYTKNPRSKINKSFAITSTLFSFWILDNFFMGLTNSHFLARNVYALGSLLFPSVLIFTSEFCGNSVSKIRKVVYWAIGSLFFILSFTKLFIKEIISVKLGTFEGTYGIIFYFWSAYMTLFIIYTVFVFVKYYRISQGLKKLQIKYVATGFISTGIFGILVDVILPLLGNKNWMAIDSTAPLLYLSFTAYAIIKYRLMDIKIIITRTGIFIAVYTLVLGFPFALALWLKGWLIGMSGANWWMLPLGLMAALATLGPFIYIYLQGKAEERLHREQRRYQDILKQASLGMTRIRDLRKLLSLITHIVTKTVKIAYIAIYLYNRETDEYILVVSRDKGRVGIPKLTPDNPLVNWIVFKREPLIYEEIKHLMLDSKDATYKHLEKNMRLLTAAVIIPIFLEDRFMGFIVLGEKISGQIYTPEDLNVFQVLASQSALAIENAQFYNETKKMQEQIAHAEKMATIGTMADGLSHQINNRFYALSLIAGDTIDTIKMTNTSKCTPEVKEMIGQINHALERVKVNVMQGAEVVKGMLKYSRPQDKAFETLTLDQIIDGTLDMVQYKVRLSELDIVRDYPKDTPKIKGNLAQLIEVFFNFIDNAYDSIVERRELLKEEGYRGRIVISTHPKIEEGVLEIVVEDNGIGIKEQDSKKIFTPFFTTKTSSRKGTGLGLYVIRRIIAELHKGKIAFESQYKVGTRFIIELAIAK